MLIRSQDKKNVFNLNTMENIQVYKDQSACYVNIYFPDIKITLGEYSSDGKGIKVLDEICERYQSSLYCDHAFDMSANVQRPYIFANNEVYQMPQDEEVIE